MNTTTGIERTDNTVIRMYFKELRGAAIYAFTT